jgi:hypothetical protein
MGGKAYAGSRLQVQIYVNRRVDELNAAIVAAEPELRDARFEWVSPLEFKDFSEYRDNAALKVLGCDKLAPALAEFWPAGGPRWDALARVTTGRGPGVVLVEAKSYPAEAFGPECRAGEASRPKIEKTLQAVKEALGVPAECDWLGPLYQSANRLAYLRFLGGHGVLAWLVNLYVIGDVAPRHTTRDEWAHELPLFRRALLGDAQRVVPGVVSIFLAARNAPEL